MTTASAYNPADVPAERYPLGDLTLENGRAIEQFVISYVTHGTLNADRSNAVLVTSSIGGDAHRLDFLIGPGLALDPVRYFIVATDAIGNGKTTSPSNSSAQPQFGFPRFSIRDMVRSQLCLLERRFRITHLVAVAGASMGGMQALQWGVSHRDFMDAIVAVVPLARTPAWSIAVNETSRKILMAGAQAPAEPPVTDAGAWRAWTDFMHAIVGRTPEGLASLFPNGSDVLPWMAALEDEWLARRLHAVDWVYQTWAYDDHDVGRTEGFNGDTAAALRSIRARTLILSAPLDLYNPVEEPAAMARLIPDVRWLQIPSCQGHASSSRTDPRSVAFMNQAIRDFLRGVEER